MPLSISRYPFLAREAAATKAATSEMIVSE